MDSVKSIKGYGKVDEEAGKVDEDTQDLVLKREIKKQLIMIGVSVVVLVVIGCLAAFAPLLSRINHPTPIPELTPAASLRIVCSVTRYPASCISSISKLPSSNTTADPKIIFRLSLKVVLDELNSICDLPKKLSKTTDNERIKSALGVCGDLFHEAIDRVNETVSAMDIGDGKKNILNSTKIYDLQTWLRAAVTDQDTCLDALSQNNTVYANSTIPQTLKSAMINSTEFTNNSLAILKIFLH